MKTSAESVQRIARRKFLGAAGSVIAMGGTALAHQSTPQQLVPRTKGPLVWLDMDQKELDDAYDQTVYAPNQPLLAARRKVASESVIKRFGPPARVAYGSSAIEKFDIYKTNRANAPVNVYIHGGAWRNGTAKDFAFLAETFVNAGAHCVILDFIQVQDAAGNLMPMIQQVRSAVAWVYKNAGSFGGDPNRIYITGRFAPCARRIAKLRYNPRRLSSNRLSTSQ